MVSLIAADGQAIAQEKETDVVKSNVPSGYSSNKLTWKPTLFVSESYNSNVFLTTPDVVRAAGQKPGDYVTTVSPQLGASSELDVGRVVFLMRGNFSSYVENRELNYAGAAGSFNLNLNRIIQRIVPTAGLNVFQGAFYSPVLPSSLGGVASQPQSPDAAGGAEPSNPNSVFISGVQPARQSALLTTTSVSFFDRVNPRTMLTTLLAYDRSIFFGTSAVAGAPQNISASFYRLNQSVNYQVSNVDTGLATYLYGQSAGGPDNFQFHSGTVGWTHLFSPSISGTVMGGAALILPTNSVQQTYSGVLTWYTPVLSSSLSYSRHILPSFSSQSGPLASHVLTAAFRAKHTQTVFSGGSLSYGRNEVLASSSAKGEFINYGANAFLSYAVLSWANVSAQYSYGHYDQSAFRPDNIFEQHVVTLNFSVGAPAAFGGAGGGSY
jgi:hypothetical protein